MSLTSDWTGWVEAAVDGDPAFSGTLSSSFTGWVEAAVDVDPATGDLSSGLFTGWVEATTGPSPGVEYWLASGSWKPAVMVSLTS